MEPLSQKVIEESAELIQAICKAEEFGYNNYDPAISSSTGRYTNKHQVYVEIQDLKSALNEYEKYITHLYI